MSEVVTTRDPAWNERWCEIMEANSLVRSTFDVSRAYCLIFPFEPVAGTGLAEIQAMS